MMNSDHELLELAVRLARQAGEAILSIRRTGFTVHAKSDHSPVTAADHAAEALIVAGLRAAVPALPVIAEEEMANGHPASCHDTFWLVDPLDGTRDFAAGHDNFCVNIGLVRNGCPVLGAVRIPALGETFLGGPALGAWRDPSNGIRVPISARVPPPEGFTVVASRSHHRSERLSQFLASHPVAGLLHYGSAEKICRIAEGVADLYPRFGRTMEWDTAAPQAVLEAAGGRLTTHDGTALQYGKPRYENGPFLAQGVGAALTF